MEGSSEMRNFAMICTAVPASLIYCHMAGNEVKPGLSRLITVLPIISLFQILPLSLQSIFLVGTISFFISWLATFKLLLFSFGRGPLSEPLSASQFVATACFPIRNSTEEKDIKEPSIRKYAIKVVLAAVLMLTCDYHKALSERAVQVLFGLLLCLYLDIILAVVAALARVALGAELEPHFDRPLLATSLQNFWGRRWNLIVTGILRPTVYEPFREVATKLIGRERATYPAVVVTFAVSGLMHEMIIYHMGRLKPTGEVTWFFLLHGFCVATEIFVKRTVAGRVTLPRAVSGALTIVFVLTSAFWLFFPSFFRLRIHIRIFEEYAAAGAIVRNLSSTIAEKARCILA